MDQASSDKIIDAICINCNKRFKSMRAVSMHLRITGTRHAVNITNHGHYDKKTGLREPLWIEFQSVRVIRETYNYQTKGWADSFKEY